ncbi:uncharacterized protein B0H64DRAFT_231974 [Chaetomium fimeti]|uniref:Uncharacterized protein n=1 Tax=Chaetomium fimeti TaxID=1854472 RepID=A0AAE0HBK7_9PEZI|nr:hypothetical protein B0H64DRAFT_231974 [Chaetomium fimeti]
MLRVSSTVALGLSSNPPRGAVFDIPGNGGFADHQGGDRCVGTHGHTGRHNASRAHLRMRSSSGSTPCMRTRTAFSMSRVGSLRNASRPGRGGPHQAAAVRQEQVLGAGLLHQTCPHAGGRLQAPCNTPPERLLPDIPRAEPQHRDPQGGRQARRHDVVRVRHAHGGRHPVRVRCYRRLGVLFFLFLSAAAKNRHETLPGGLHRVPRSRHGNAPPQQLQDRFDGVMSTNCIHASKSLAVSCSNSQRLLRVGGLFALVEFTTWLYRLDIVFGLLDGRWLFENDKKHCMYGE